MSATTALRKQQSDEVIPRLRQLLGDRLSTAEAVREQHGKGESYHPVAAPDAVAFAVSTEEVSEIVGLCGRYRIPVIPFGTGTSLEGHVAALEGGICIDVSGMKEVVRLSVEDMDVTVQAGVTRKQLNEHLRDTGLFFPIDPGADASIGGMAATRASGTNAVRYGTMRENVLGLTVVLADGRVIKTGGRARKSSAGYDLTRLFIGSEGTLGVITEVTLRLYGIPEAISAGVCAFPTIRDAVDTVIATIQSGVPVARMEYVDPVSIDAINRFFTLDYAVAPTLFLEFHGTHRAVEEQAEQVKAIAGDFGGVDFRWATKPEERTKLWQARHDALYASVALRPGSKGWATDVCVPISRLADCIAETSADIEQSGVLAPIVGHVGDGNFHLVFLIRPDETEEFERAEWVNKRMIERALKMGGTCTGEHGIGYGKVKYLQAEHGPDALSVMGSVKRALDPDNIMNPGKMLAV